MSEEERVTQRERVCRVGEGGEGVRGRGWRGEGGRDRVEEWVGGGVGGGEGCGRCGCWGRVSGGKIEWK